MKIAVTTGSISRLSGGLFNSVRHFSQSVSSCGGDVTCQVFSPVDSYTAQDKDCWSPLSTNVYPCLWPKSAGLSFPLLSAVTAFSPDIIHQHGLWMLYSLASTRRAHKIVSPHGMLDPWALKNSAYKKLIAGFAFENKNLRRAACIHALCEREYDAIREFGLTNPVCIIPNGVVPVDPQIWKKKSAAKTGRKTLLYLGRIHPKKGLVNLIKAWGMLGADCHKNWKLVVAGWDEVGHLEELVNLAQSLRVNDSIEFPGPQYGDDKESLFVSADGFILPSFSEGLPLVVLEAWSYGLPVLMTAECNIPDGFTANAALEIRPNPDSILKVLKRFTQFEVKQLRDIGERGALLVRENYDWRLIGQKMYSVYRWLQEQQDMPDFIRLD